MASKAVSRMKLNPSENTVRGHTRILNFFIDFIQNLEEGEDYHGFTHLKPIELGLKGDEKEYAYRRFYNDFKVCLAFVE